MILAAGLGSRLGPLTETTPKALVQVGGLPLIEHVIRRLKKAGMDELIINVHHMAEQIIDFLDARGNLGIRIEVSVEKELLGTGGGLQKAAWFFDDGRPFLLHNVDVLSDLDYAAMWSAHANSDVLGTIAVRDRRTSRYFLFDSAGMLVGWQKTTARPRAEGGQGVRSTRTQDVVRIVREPDGPAVPLSFTGIHVLSPRILSLLTEDPPFSIRDTYLRLAAEGERIRAYRSDGARWLDLGRPENLQRAREVLGSEFFEYADSL